MNLFEKIRELKFPFIALVAAMSFSGLVAPASATVPLISNVMTSTPSTNSTQISITVSKAGGCRALLRLDSSSSASQADVLAANGPGGLNLAFVVSPVAVDGANTTILFSSLTLSTNYIAYIVCEDGASSDTSSRYAVGFTQQAFQGGGGGGGSFPPCQNATDFTGVRFSVSTLGVNDTYLTYPGSSNETNCSVTVTGYGVRQEIDGQLMRPAAFGTAGSNSVIFSNSFPVNLAFIQSRNTNNIPIVDGSTYTQKYYAGLSAAPTANDVPVRVISMTLYNGVAPSNNNNNQQQQQSTTSVRPAPAFTITNRPTVSANGQSLTLKGDNLSDVTAVKVAGKEAKISKKASGEIVIDVPAGTEGFPDVELLHAGGAITMQGLIQVIKPYALTRSLNITKFVGNRPTLAGLGAIEQAYLAGTTANVLTCVATVASDASAEEVAKTESRAKATCARVVNYSKYIKTADVQIKKDGAAGSKPVLAVTFDRTLDGK